MIGVDNILINNRAFSLKLLIILAILYFFFGTEIKNFIFDKAGFEPKDEQEETSKTKTEIPESGSNFSQKIDIVIGNVKQKVMIFINDSKNKTSDK